MIKNQTIRPAALLAALAAALLLLAAPDYGRAQQTNTASDISVTVPDGWTSSNDDSIIVAVSPKEDFAVALSVIDAQGLSTEKIKATALEKFAEVQKSIKHSMEGDNLVVEFNNHPEKKGDAYSARAIFTPVHSGYYTKILISNMGNPDGHNVYQDETRAIIKSFKSSDPDKQAAIDGFKY